MSKNAAHKSTKIAQDVKKHQLSTKNLSKIMYLTTYALKNKTVCQNKVYNKSVIVLSGASDSCLMCDYVRIINFRIMFNRHRAKNTLAQLF